MNKTLKIILGVVVVAAIIYGIYYFYQKNKKTNGGPNNFSEQEVMGEPELEPEEGPVGPSGYSGG